MKILLGLIIGVGCSSGLATAAIVQPSVAAGATSVSPKEQAVYEAVLGSWLGPKHGRQLVRVELDPAPATSDPDLKDCTKALRFCLRLRPGQAISPSPAFASG